MEKSNIPEEVTITPVIRDVERLTLRLFAFIKSSIFFLVKRLIKSVQLGLKYFVLLALVSIVGGIAGFFSEGFFPRNYVSTIIVKPSVNAKAQLHNDVNYINSLIQKEEIETLTNLLDITVDDAKSLNRMKVMMVTSEMEKLRYIDDFYKKLDTATKNNFSLSRLLNEGDEIYGKKFGISVYGVDPTVFSKLEPKFLQFLERVPELQAKRKAAIKLLQYQKKFYLKQLSDLDTLKKVINTVKLAEANKTTLTTTTSISLGSQQRAETINILEVYDRSNEFFSEIVSTESKLFDLTTCYKIYSRFSEYGIHKGTGKLKRALIGGGALFVLTLILLEIVNALSAIKRRDA
ncbi:MAG: hypothetical protein JKY48_16435 [Flavobacteriales bacterium]|nr:hypothetical protein [Flavobacteriales bacterium]